LSDNRYQVIKSPIDADEAKSFLGKSEKGVYFATIDDCQLQVWILTDRTEWVLMHHSGLKPDAWYCNQGSIFEGPWILDDYQKRMWKEWVLTRHGATNRKKVMDHYRAKKKKRRFAPRRGVGWDSDDDNIIDTAGVGVSRVR